MIDDVVFSVDTAPLEEAVERSNRSMSGFRDRSRNAIGAVSQDLGRLADMLERRLSSGFDRVNDRALAFHDRMRGSMTAMSNYATSIGRVGAELTKLAALSASTAAIAGRVVEKEISGWSRLETAINGARLARIGYAAATAGASGAAVVAAEIAAVIAAEQTLQIAYERGAKLREQGIRSVTSGFDYATTVRLGFATSRMGVPADFLDNGVRQAGSIERLGQSLKQLGEIRDPVLQARAAFEEFGADFQKYLPFANDRLERLTDLSKQFGMVLNGQVRSDVGSFTRDIDILGRSVKDVADDFSALAEAAKNWIGGTIGGLYRKNVTDTVDLVRGTQMQRDLAADSQRRIASIAKNALAAASPPASDAALAAGAQAYGESRKLDPEADRADAVSGRDRLAAQLFRVDLSSPSGYSRVPEKDFPGGAGMQAMALQIFNNDVSRIVQLDREIAASKTAADAVQKSSSALEQLVQASQQLSNKDGGLPRSTEALRLLGEVSKSDFPAAMKRANEILKEESKAELKTLTTASAFGIQGAPGYVGTNWSTLQDLTEKNEAFQKARLHPYTSEDLIKQGLTENELREQLLVARASGIRQSAIAGDRSAMSLQELQQLGASRIAGIGDTQSGASVRNAEREFAIKKEFADKQLAYNLDLAKEEHLNDGRLDAVTRDLKIEYSRQVFEAQTAFAETAAQEQRRQLETLASSTQGLFHTLLTKPSQFPKQLGNTLHEAIVRPIAEGASNLTARALQPFIYGADGNSGIGGIFRGAFGGKQDPMKISTDMNSTVTAQNSAAVMALTAVLAGGMGMSMPRVPSVSVMGSSISMPSISVPASPATISVGGGSTFGMGAGPSGYSGPDASTLQALTGPGGTAGFTGPVGLGGGGGGLAGGGGFNLGSLRGIGGNLGNLGKLIGYQGGGFWKSAPGQVYGGANSVGSIAGSIATSPAAGMAGMMLAQNGVFGSNRGTWKGTFEDAAGGALIGAKFGAPMGAPIMGAAIGAGVGFAVGGIEQIAGIESPENKAKQQIKNLYHININDQMAHQIAALAQSKYGGNVATAVHSPEVRQMLGLYAAGTGQNFPMSASMPHAGSLVEQGGSLFQAATYQYGNPYTFQSNLPVLGPSGGNIPSPASPNLSLSLNIAGEDAGNFLAGSVVTPDFVQSQYSAALASSNGRLSNSATIQQPGLVIS